MRFPTPTLIVVTALAGSGPALTGRLDAWFQPQPAAVQFEPAVRPLLRAHCMPCHGLEHRKGELDLRSVALVLRGGKNGPVIQPGSPDRSLLFQKVSDRSMPPKGELPLSDEQISTIRQWIATASFDREPQGDPPRPLVALDDEDRNHWAFRSPTRPQPPHVRTRRALRTPVDQYLVARLEANGLQYSPPGAPHTLVRRLYLDLIGLPPAPIDVDAFLDDRSADAYDRLVDRLLASPHFGQRWGRRWLDAAGYVDTIGDDTDAGIAKLAAGKWRYREYVIDSLNRDKPLDLFVREQVAGDEMSDWRNAEQLTAPMLEQLIATTFLRSAADETLQTELNTADIRHEVLARTMEVTIHNLLGLTIQCARCHDHKYDPIPQDDYYRLLACFSPAFDPQRWLQPADRELPDVSPKEKARIDAHNTALDQRIADTDRRRESILKPYRDRLAKEKLSALPAVIRGDIQAALTTTPAKRDAVQKYLVMKLGKQLAVADAEVTDALGDQERRSDATLRGEVRALRAQTRTWGTIQAVYDTHRPPPTYLLTRGNHQRPGYQVGPGLLRVLDPPAAPTEVGSEHTAGSSGRRTSLATWLTRRDSPAAGLLARVLVNRDWQHLFGRGIVQTSDNFGIMGASPDHPDLLEGMAVELMETGWRHKALLKTIVTSSAYRQRTRTVAVDRAGEGPPQPVTTDPQVVDPANRLFWRMPLRQLESEVIRDSILAISGQLDRSFGGAPILTKPRPDGFVRIDPSQLKQPRNRVRRSLYLLQRRRYHESFLESFGQPELTKNCTQRVASAVVGQSLTLMNDRFMFEQSSRFAARVLQEGGQLPHSERIAVAFRLALARPPHPAEHRWASDLVTHQTERYRQQPDTAAAAERHGLRHLCHMLLCTNEFLYVP